MDIFSNLMVIGECLLDKRRTLAFKRAIERTVKSGDVVIDVGTGSGVLAMLSAKAGAKKVYGVEIASDVAKFARQNVATNKLTDKVEIINADMKTYNFPHNVDVVTMELMDTGLVAEQQGVVNNWLIDKGIITSKTRLIPYRYQCAFELVNYDFNFYGLDMSFVIQARNFAAQGNIKKKLSKNVIYRDVNFSQHVNTTVDETVNVEIADNGFLNALVLKSKTFLSKNQAIWGTTDLNMPVIIPLEEKKVSKGQVVKIRVKYEMGEGFENFSAKII